MIIAELRDYYENKPVDFCRSRLREAKDFLHCLKVMVDSGVFEEAHILALRTMTEHQIAILEEIIKVSEDTIKALKGQV